MIVCCPKCGRKLTVEPRLFGHLLGCPYCMARFAAPTPIAGRSRRSYFFSGSATTAHVVMKLNADDGGKRKFIMVQLPERGGEGWLQEHLRNRKGARVRSSETRRNVMTVFHTSKKCVETCTGMCLKTCQTHACAMLKNVYMVLDFPVKKMV